MSLPPRLVCLDTVMVDFSMMIESLPDRGGDAHSSKSLISAGGGFNVMSAVRRHGRDALYVGQLGQGPFADVARETLLAEGVTVSVPPRGEQDLGVCVVLIDARGERTFVTSSGAELTLEVRDLAETALTAGDVVYLSGYNVLYPEVSAMVTRWVSELSPEIRVAFDPGPRVGDIDPDVLGALLERTDWLLCNADEAQRLSAEDEVVTAAQSLKVRWECELVVVRDGPRGCVSVYQGELRHAEGFPAVVVDTNGAGDVHNGVLMAELLRMTGLDEALVRANAGAAIAIGIAGPATCPARSAIDEMLELHHAKVTRLES